MILRKLQVDGLRCLRGVQIELAPRMNVFTGPNGAGKTSVLEAVYLLSRGRSFRSGGSDVLIRRGADELNVFAQLESAGERSRLGIGRRDQRWRVNIDGVSHASLGGLLGRCAVVCFEPGSHELISGASERRRRYLDWGVFHVEHTFLQPWRRYRRALQQRNTLLRSRGSDEQMEAWELELDIAGTLVDQQRTAYVHRLSDLLSDELAQLIPELGAAQVHYRRGWDRTERLRDALKTRRPHDTQRGHTTVGAHRADWSVAFAEAPAREHLSRGQEKLVALACVLVQGSIYAEDHAEWPIVCLDDLASELDQVHRVQVVARLLTSGAQMLVTGTDFGADLQDVAARTFHVEHGGVRKASESVQ